MMKKHIDYTVFNRKLSGTVSAIASKSQAHRLLICAAFSAKNTTLKCAQTNQDMDATAQCLNSLGATITRTNEGYEVQPIRLPSESAVLNCRESGSTLRFLLPVVGALGVDAIFELAGRLPDRPLSPLWEEMERMGCILDRPTKNTIHCRGKLQPGHYTISGSVSSQFTSGLLFAMSLMQGQSFLQITGTLESAPYVQMTQQALSLFGVSTDSFCITGAYPFHSPRIVPVEGDWSNAAFFLAADSLGGQVTVTNLNPNSAQGDRAIQAILCELDKNVTISAADIPDLVPILSVVAASKKGATFTHIGRLRLKESDRVASVSQMLQNLGCHVESTADTLTVYPGSFGSCTVDSAGDHRIAMSAAIAATVASGPVTILDADCVSKSYPDFWNAFSSLGGSYEQYIR